MKNIRAKPEGTKIKNRGYEWTVNSLGSHARFKHPEGGTDLVVRKRDGELTVLGIHVKTEFYNVKKHEERIRNGENWVVGERDLTHKFEKLPDAECKRLATLIAGNTRKEYEQALKKKKELIRAIKEQKTGKNKK